MTSDYRLPFAVKMAERKLMLLLSVLATDFVAQLISTETNCGTTARRVRRDDLEVIGHHIYGGSFNYRNERAVYFSGSEIVTFRKLLLLNERFTVEIWVKPEGGQLPDVAILNYFDRCRSNKKSQIWTLGVKQFEQGRDSRFYFTLKTHRIREQHTVAAHEGYRPGIWVHVAAVFNGTSLHLFINQALVAVSHNNLSPVLAIPESKCQVLELGGNSRKGQFFRGTVDDLKILNKAKRQREIIRNMFLSEVDSNPEEIVLFERFEGLPNHGGFDLSFHSTTASQPEFIHSTVPRDLHQIEVRRPFCGVTVCDNPDIVRGYKESSNLRRSKTLRYRLINIAEDDGKNPLLSNKQIKLQHQKLNDIFSKYNISWEIVIHTVRNSSLRYQTFLFDCKSRKETKCKKGMQIEELKRIANLDNREYLNVFVGRSKNKIRGVATMPWEISVYGINGGTVLDIEHFAVQKGVHDMVHELGHNLGLLHVHQGIPDCGVSCSKEDCDNPCLETHASMELGDLCADTNPTPLNRHCRDPKRGACGIAKFKDTPFRNFMGYGDCANEFTMDQVARMHCYIDHFYQNWTLHDTPSAVPIRPKVLAFADGVLELEWLPPLGLGRSYAARKCNQCDLEERKLHQFAVTAHSPGRDSYQKNNLWEPHQATGPPDSKKCRVSGTIWKMHENEGTSATIELGFEKEVVPIAIKVWMTYNKKNAPFDTEILHVDKSVTFLGSAIAQCDVPYTRRIVTKKAANKVRLRVGKNTGIDAVQLVSEEQTDYCKACPLVEYIIERKPRFQSGDSIKVSSRRFLDKEVKGDVPYEYRIYTVVGNLVSKSSLPLMFQANTGFCGDGIIQKENGEQCDDGNLRNGDGCSIQCKSEDVFKCKGQPSICYRTEGDGVCEDFERQTSPADCGFYVPEGFEQQWAVSSFANPSYRCVLPKGAMAGPPRSDLKCVHAWSSSGKRFSCIDAMDQRDYWIQFRFEDPVVAASVVLYIESDLGSEDRSYGKISIELVDIGNNRHNIGTTTMNCKRHPLVMPVLHDLTKPYFKTKAVRVLFHIYHATTITAVAIRSSKILNPAIASSCDAARNEYYNPRTHSCHPYKCRVPACKPLAVKKAEISCKGTNDGDTCKITCLKGHLPAKTLVVKCILGKWSSPDFKCLPVDCGKIKIKNAKVECKHGTRYKSICSFHCIGQARMVGVDNKISCMEDGLWSARNAWCQLYCPEPPIVKNSYPLDYRCDAKHVKVRKQNEMGTECKFQCQLGYYAILGPSNAAGTLLRLTCNEDGLWVEDAKCVIVQCPELSEFDKAVYNCTKGNQYGSVCRTVCPLTNETHEVSCQANAKWSSGFNHCEYTGVCDSIPSTNEITYKSCSRDVKGYCYPKCKTGGYDAVIKGEEHLHNIKLQCLPDLSWHPSPDRIYCMKSCMNKYRGDTICDCTNNNKHCNYDDGDCCEVSVKKRVEFIGSLRCGCIDPKAVEETYEAGSGDETVKADYNDDEDGDDVGDDVNGSDAVAGGDGGATGVGVDGGHIEVSHA